MRFDMIVAFIGIVSMILLLWTLAFAMGTESSAERRRIQDLLRDNRVPPYKEPANHAA